LKRLLLPPQKPRPPHRLKRLLLPPQKLRPLHRLKRLLLPPQKLRLNPKIWGNVRAHLCPHVPPLIHSSSFCHTKFIYSSQFNPRLPATFTAPRSLSMSLLIKSLATAFALSAVAGCASHRQHYENLWDQEEIAQFNHDDIYQVHHDGRIYLFDDQHVFLDFLANKETPFRLTQIGAGPQGETVVFGLRAKDKEKLAGDGVSSVAFSKGALKPFKRFYGEWVTPEQIIVVNDIELLQHVVKGQYKGTLTETPLKGNDGQPVRLALRDAAHAKALEELYQTTHSK
jgi:hypothetical protein